MLTSIFPTICATDVSATSAFYADLFDFATVFDGGWYVQLASPHNPLLQIGIVERDHASVPEPFRQQPAGVLISIEVDDVDVVHERARAAQLTIPLALRDEPFGQRHFMTVDPAGTLVDVITPIEPQAEYVAMYAPADVDR